jgi:hypothetical protein
VAAGRHRFHDLSLVQRDFRDGATWGKTPAEGRSEEIQRPLCAAARGSGSQQPESQAGATTGTDEASSEPSRATDCAARAVAARIDS